MKTTVNLIAGAMLLAAARSALAVTHYVDLNSPSPMPPFTNWATAARVIQDAVDAAVAGDEVVVTNGIYATGGRAVYGTMTNRVAVDKPLSLRSVNGPQFTIIQGYQVPGTTNGDCAIRCVYLAGGATLSGFGLTAGARRGVGDSANEQSGGGLWCVAASGVVSNCVLTGNSAFDDGAVAINQAVKLSHSFASAGGFTVGLRAHIDSFPGVVGAMETVQVLANSVHYVASGSTNPVAPYNSWATTATNIPKVVEAAFVGGKPVSVGVTTTQPSPIFPAAQ